MLVSRLDRFIVVLAVLGPLLVAPHVAEAFDQFSEGCGNKQAARIEFAGSEWSQQDDDGTRLDTLVYWGYDNWHLARDWTGGRFLDKTAGPVYTMTWDGRLNYSTYAMTRCAATDIAFNIDRIRDFRRQVIGLEGLATHEWGHVLGLGHTGRYDSHDGDHPATMSTCNGSQFYGHETFNQDDHAGIAYLSERQAYEGRTFHGATANNSFEYGARFWNRRNTSWQSLSGGVDGSSKKLRMSSSGYRSYIWNTTRVTDLQRVFGDATMHGARVTARANINANNPNTTGDVRVMQAVRNIGYVDGTNWGCNFYYDLKNQYDQSEVGNYYNFWSRYCVPPDYGWTYCDTPTDYIEAQTDALDVRVWAYNRLKSGGSWTTVDVDRVRIRVSFN